MPRILLVEANEVNRDLIRRRIKTGILTTHIIRNDRIKLLTTQLLLRIIQNVFRLCRKSNDEHSIRARRRNLR